MGRFMKGDVVVLPFPFADLSSSKKRPSLVLTDLIGGDVILCQITTPSRADGYSIPLLRSDFVSGKIDHDSTIRPNCIFTADSKIIAYRAGKISQAKIDEVIGRIIKIING